MHQRHVNAVQRTPEEIRSHYLAEKDLANQLRLSMPEERGALYLTVYEELFRRVPNHPILFRTVKPEQKESAIRWQLQFLQRFLKPSHSFVEIGAGDCTLALAVAKRVKQVYAVDVSAKLTESIIPPKNFELRVSDGCSVDVPDNSVDVAYSNQLMEHLHPDDALRQVREVYRALKPGGVYVCVTPNRLGGPYDISRYFDTVATGLHLKEYTVTECSAPLSLRWVCTGPILCWRPGSLFRPSARGDARLRVYARDATTRLPPKIVRFDTHAARHDDPTCGDEGLKGRRQKRQVHRSRSLPTSSYLRSAFHFPYPAN